MELYIDLDIKTECELIASDVIDMSGGMVQSEFTKVPIIYDLDEHQEGWWRENQEAASVDRSHSLEGQPPHLSRFHSTTLFINSQEMPENDTDDAVKRDGCRIHGAVDVAMVKGNFHFTGGELKANTGNKHIHTNIPLAKMNFTHRIRHLSFAHPGEHYPDLVSGLDGSDAVIESMLGSTQYHLNVVPTEYEYASASILWDNVGSQVKNWYTYSYMKDPKEGFPGIFFTFDITALKMHVKEHNRSILTAIIRLVGLLGGVFATSDMIHRFVIRSVATVRRQSTDFHSLLRDSSSGSLSSASVLAFDMPSAPKPA
ncbi:hypothetical protein SARC_12060 [Sphaeroforma arctica JP610]|uniref:Endoplasmic reticulum vesicle transporter C-terminal domain-containing protein n=1 Tax=Sphaeroforma arctica JP610 TaxID=667725 RepID=A0A0L0FF55_9EUKA|nr:hypothetical protein SARC_12060 [Sphaeroforma arctica JP610]KNC75412.1 hypothetical protein SARC_12060 [Sphaeroforma arctica JP610]|eukprot:XP_014149314.1 hypothetical protein SARC_12060 [Sphaeroforma arctica JP610]